MASLRAYLPNREILRLAVPNILANLVVPLQGMVDDYLMGREPNAAFLGATGVGGILFAYLYWMFGFLRMGTTGLTAQAHGAEDLAEVHRLLWRGLVLAMGAGVALIALQWPIRGLAFELIAAQDPLVETLARRYFDARIWAAPATLGTFALVGWFLGREDARSALLVSVAANGLNILFSWLLVVQYGWSISGVGWGTALGSWGGFLLGLGIVAVRYRRHLRWPTGPLWAVDILRRYVALNRDILVRTLLVITVYALFIGKSAAISTPVLDANNVFQKLILLAAFAIDGFQLAAESLVGKYYGQANRRQLRRVLRPLFTAGWGLGLAFALAYTAFGASLLRFFAPNHPEVWCAGEAVQHWLVLYVLLMGPVFVWDGILLGLTAGGAMRNSMLITAAVYVPVFWLLGNHLGNDGLWIALLVALGLRWVTMQQLARPILRAGGG